MDGRRNAPAAILQGSSRRLCTRRCCARIGLDRFVEFDANRTTDAWRTSIDVSANYRDTKFVLDEDEDEGEGEEAGSRTLLSVRRNLEASGILVKSLTQHWSFGLMASAESQTFRNFVLDTRVAPHRNHRERPFRSKQ